MPRSGWLALGSVLAALAASQPWAGQAWLAQPVTWLLLGGSWLAVVLRWRARPTGSTSHGPLLPAIVVLAGALLVGVRLVALPASGPTGAVALPGGSGPWTATVEAIGNPRNGSQVATVQLATTAGSALLVSITAPADPPIGVGDVLSLNGRLQPLSDDDYGAFLASGGIGATLQSTSLRITGSTGTPAAVVDRIRREAGDGLAVALPEPEAGLAAGILIGLRDRVDRDLANAFTTAGVSHIVAISGWNIAIVAALVGAALRRWPRRRRSIATLLVIALYTVFTGASASVIRAALMTASVTVARESGRAGSAAAALGWAAVIMLVVDPGTVGDAGFQLSSLATAGLIAWATPLTRRIEAWRGGLVPSWLAESLGVSFAAEAATLPVVLLAFGRLAIIAPAVNLIVVPLVPPAMAAGTLALLAGLATNVGLPPEAAALLGLPGWAVLGLMVGIVQFAAALPFASVTLTPPFNLAAAGLVAVLVLGVALGPVRARLGEWVGRSIHRATTPGSAAGRSAGIHAPPARSTVGPTSAARGPIAARVSRLRSAIRLPADRPSRLLAMALATTVLGLLLIAAHRADGVVRIDVLDVGQGDAILVQGDHGGRLLIDGGPDPDKLMVALDARIPPWDRRIDLLILTHPHEDHVAGMARLLDRYRVAKVVQPGMIGPGPGYRAFMSALLRHNLSLGRLNTGDTLQLDSIAFKVLWPDPGAVPREPPDTGTGINNVSIVLLGTIERHRFLLMGDVEEEIDPILLARGLPRVEVLKVAHHGSRTSSTGPFLDAVRPGIAVISAGLHNPYGHPAPETVERLLDHGVNLFRTDLNGTVDIALEHDHWVAHPDRSATTSTRPRPSATSAASIGLFGCAVPDPVLVSALTATGAAATPSAAAPPAGSGAADALLYDRPDVRARPSGGGPPAPQPGSAALAPPPFTGRGGDRRLARRAHRPQRHSRESPGRGGGGPAARRGQAARARRSCGRAPPRRRLRGMAHSPRPSGARSCRGESPGRQACRRDPVSALVGIRVA
jgi:competence protein ComEC